MKRRLTSLRGRMIFGSGLLVCGVIGTGAGSVAAVSGLRQDFGVATDGYRQLRQLFGAGYLLSRTRQALGQSPPAIEAARDALRAARGQLSDRSSDSVDGPPGAWVDESARVSCLSLVDRADAELAKGPTSPAVDLLFARLSQTTGDVRRAIEAATAAADRRRHQAVLLVSAFGSVTALAVAAATAGLYRRVMRPMDQLAAGARAIAGGDYDHSIDAGTDREFSALAEDFDAMAGQLRAVHRGLQQQVAVKTRELSRAGRLAEVGVLAAGVAHEINNPLGIIAGYAERAMRNLPADDPARRPLSVIGEQAFRCKQITDKLLSLSRPMASTRAVVSLGDVASEVGVMIREIGKACRIEVSADPSTAIWADAGEINQVVLNLVLNGIESGATVIEVTVRQLDSSMVLSVSDDGCGMSAERVGRVFEPFFTDKSGIGTGLGLSIARAIVADHGGTIEAFSDGPGKGSRFVVTLPGAEVGRG